MVENKEEIFVDQLSAHFYSENCQVMIYMDIFWLNHNSFISLRLVALEM